MRIDLSVLVTKANKLEYINKNEKQEQDKKDKQLYDTIERKVKKEKHKHEKTRSRDGTLKECKRLLKEGASPEVLIKLEASLREQEKYYRYYIQCFLPVLGEVVERSKRISNETKNQVISEITKSCLSRYNEQDSGYGSDFEDEMNGISDSDSDFEDEVNRISDSDNDVQLLNAIQNGNNRKFRKYLKNCTNISGITDEKGNNILHLIASLKKKQKLKFLDTLIKIANEKNLAQLVDSENQEGKTPFQVALINKIIKGKHDSHTIQDNDNTFKFLTKLLEYGANSDNLGLSTKELQYLKEEQKTYYCDFLEKLAKSVKKPELKSEIRTKIKEIIPHTINTPDSNDNYQLHLAIKNKDEKSFKELLQKGADISLKDTDGNNALHLIVLELKQKRKFEFSNIILNVSKEEEKEHLKAQFKKAINAENTAKQTPLYYLFQHIKEKNEDRSCTDKKFEKTNRYKALELFLQNGADITAQDKEGNNILHHIALLKGEQKIACLELISDKDRFSNSVNTTNRERLTPLHQLFQYIKEKNENRSCTDKKFEKTNKYKALELFLQNSADITAQDKEGNNALHYIASLKGEQKVACLELISSLVKEKEISEDQLGKAIKAINEEGRTPLQVSLTKKAEKGNHLSQMKTIFDLGKKYDNTTKFCAKLLEIGADSRSLKLKDREFHTEKYYCTLRNLENYSKTPQEGKVKAKELRKKLEKKYNIRTFSKKCQHILHKTGDGLKAAWKCIDPGRRASILLAITVATTIITMVTLSCFQGQIAIGAALPIIAITGMVCLIVTLGLSGIRKHVKELTNDQQTSKDNLKTATQPENVTEQQNLANNSAEQEVQRSSNQSEHTESPATQMSYVSILRQFINKPDGLTNKFSFPGR
ncbi:ankyrin repeat domain-containing protein [Wolbachia endosymbiont of Drosophila mauritiana]|uniref:ankyrin repeat domain-containing protein n=1 Tax=unclassified Wolbachia TaxID=2640676 RepID=UPI00107EAC84|nr:MULTISPECIES: ankyrin repeat domain-containing protein [unclassified Wolbachia]QCB62860.1 ankyrin repeat domain-containing protein [Wolbachia endosymbiont of Drosophila mauritiana]QCB63905.1 ankyrin repeat domain-containing protein [Wolbachia endosymbiont of Drosophila mauritiana]QWE33835.1 Ankyrin repeat domain protein [Wolbachia endosymbiont of Drosophila simulans]TGB07260.1 ankyrin repeat domain-containing protein [Wolbachia endosymbiont of Drosophila mauritiana]